MKIRIKGNSLRLRLSQSEIEEVKNEGRVSDSTDFGVRKLIYMLQIVDQHDISAEYNGDFITINVPPIIANPWINTEQVGFDTQINVGEGERLYVLVEKDFQCLKPRPGEDESDLFDNPLAKG